MMRVEGSEKAWTNIESFSDKRPWLAQLAVSGLKSG